MQDLFLHLAFVVSFGTVVYLFAVAVPRVYEEGQPATEKVGKRISHRSLERIDTHLQSAKDKALRRLKVFIMRADNFISEHLHKGKDTDLFKKE